MLFINRILPNEPINHLKWPINVSERSARRNSILCVDCPCAIKRFSLSVFYSFHREQVYRTMNVHCALCSATYSHELSLERGAHLQNMSMSNKPCVNWALCRNRRSFHSSACMPFHCSFSRLSLHFKLNLHSCSKWCWFRDNAHEHIYETQTKRNERRDRIQYFFR